MAEKQVYEVTVDEQGNIFWRKNGKIHRIGGPAIEYVRGAKEWWHNDKLHRLDGPAIEWPDDGKHWYQNGRRHRLGGPAIEWPNGYKEYWIEGKRYSEQEYITKIAEMKSASEPPSCAGKIVAIDGK
jgi:hypothetical protein